METSLSGQPDKIDPSCHPWLSESGLVAIWDALEAAGGEARVVGGAVRDTLLGRAVHDVDMAVNLPPDRVSAILSQAGLKVVPTGIAHGTVTVVADHKGYELTTLRHDICPDGRRSRVAFTNDWESDAARRDFTFNALYLDRTGKIHDYFDGKADLKARCVRFIGEPRARIREDHLRILRLFRFFAQIDDIEHSASIDPDSLAACSELAMLLSALSAERIGKELLRLLGVPNPLSACTLMLQKHILINILPELDKLDRLSHLIDAERGQVAPSPIRRLAALSDGDPAVIARKLRLSKAELHRLTILSRSFTDWNNVTTPFDVRQRLYQYGKEDTRDALLLASAVHDLCLDQLLTVVDVWKDVSFPLKGKDLQALGLQPGPEIGNILEKTRNWWCENDFIADRAACLARAKELISGAVNGRFEATTRVDVL